MRRSREKQEGTRKMTKQDLTECAKIFLKEQEKLLGEQAVSTVQEAEEFLEDCFAQIFDDISEVRAYFEEEGIDVDGLDDGELSEELEVFKLPDGRFFVVEG